MGGENDRLRNSKLILVHLQAIDNLVRFDKTEFRDSAKKIHDVFKTQISEIVEVMEEELDEDDIEAIDAHVAKYIEIDNQFNL